MTDWPRLMVRHREIPASCPWHVGIGPGFPAIYCGHEMNHLFDTCEEAERAAAEKKGDLYDESKSIVQLARELRSYMRKTWAADLVESHHTDGAWGRSITVVLKQENHDVQPLIDEWFERRNGWSASCPGSGDHPGEHWGISPEFSASTTWSDPSWRQK